MHFIDRFDRDVSPLLADASRVLVGVSGGADSIALLSLLSEWASSRSRPLALLVGHVHHGLRGAAADVDAAFVAGVAAGLGCPFLEFRGDARLLAKELGASPEDAARELRHRAFEAWIRAERVDALALAHHRDDQAETVLLRAIRGAGIDGLAGMSRRREFGRGTNAFVVRPLFDWARAEVEAYLRDRGLSWREDATNASDAIPRNRIRRRVLPELEQAQPGATRSLVRLAEFARETARDLDELAEGAVRSFVRPSPRGSSLPVNALLALPDSLARRVLEQLAVAAGGDPSSSVRRGAAAALRVLRRAAAPLSAVLALGSRVDVHVRYDHLYVRPRPDGASRLTAATRSIDRAGRGSARWRDWHVSVQPLAPGEESVAIAPSRLRDGIVERFDADTIGALGPLTLRGRRAGDVFRALGAPGRQKLKEFLRSQRIPPCDRDTVPLLVAGDTIVWVVGCRIGHAARCRPETKSVLAVEAHREGGPSS